jgi:predicted nucleotidyltransferase
MISLLPEQKETLCQLSELWRETPFVLIGANALALQMDLHWRQTNDLDLVVSMPLEDYPAGLGRLPGWQRRGEGEHAWRSPTGVNVDVVPAGHALLERGTLTWPESGFRMNLVGLRLAFEHHTRIDIDEQHSVAVATTPAIVVLKMGAFLDRPQREDDLTDIAQVLERYLEPTDDRRWELPTEFDNASAFALGVDVRSIINAREMEVVTEFLARAKDEKQQVAQALGRFPEPAATYALPGKGVRRQAPRPPKLATRGTLTTWQWESIVANVVAASGMPTPLRDQAHDRRAHPLSMTEPLPPRERRDAVILVHRVVFGVLHLLA